MARLPAFSIATVIAPRGALTHAGDQIRKCQRLALLTRQGFLERIADHIALAGEADVAPAGAKPSVALPLRQKQSRQTRDLHHAAKALRLEFRQQLAQHIEAAAIERDFAVRNRFDPRRKRAVPAAPAGAVAGAAAAASAAVRSLTVADRSVRARCNSALADVNAATSVARFRQFVARQSASRRASTAAMTTGGRDPGDPRPARPRRGGTGGAGELHGRSGHRVAHVADDARREAVETRDDEAANIDRLILDRGFDPASPIDAGGRARQASRALARPAAPSSSSTGASAGSAMSRRSGSKCNSYNTFDTSTGRTCFGSTPIAPSARA